jgi:FAD/FMN-containing dehydrogenase
MVFRSRRESRRWGPGSVSEPSKEALDRSGLAIPAGSSRTVRISGLTLGGGIGILGRKFGPPATTIRAQVVPPDGHIIECDERRNDDLYWALQGAGADNFGVVTSLVFRTVPTPPTTVVYLMNPWVSPMSQTDPRRARLRGSPGAPSRKRRGLVPTKPDQ